MNDARDAVWAAAYIAVMSENCYKKYNGMKAMTPALWAQDAAVFADHMVALMPAPAHSKSEGAR